MRTVTDLNGGWYFAKDVKTPPEALPRDWEEISLPHTWNGDDGQDGGNDYFRGKCCYVRLLNIAVPEAEGEARYLEFSAVNSSAEVYLDGERLAVHHGGYSAFRVKLPSGAAGGSLLAVIADNGPNDFVYPQFADFTFYGGIYRGVRLISVPKDHFDLEDCGSSGLYVTPTVEGKDANVQVRAKTQAGPGCTLRFTILADGGSVAAQEVPAERGEASFRLENVRLWDGRRDPYLYEMKAELLSGGEPADELSVRFGCRSYQIDPQKGFILNGRSCPLHGVARHQDRPHIGSALTAEHHREDIDLICELGANTVRLAHYQHAQEFYDLCDERGLIVWAEIPYISRHMPRGLDNTLSQMTELISQNYNHPSIVVWGLSNEITIGGAAGEGMLENHQKLNELAHRLDRTRLTTLAAVSTCPTDEPNTHVPDVLSYNHYLGWYGGDVSMNGPWYDKFHRDFPDRAVGLSEYGAEALDWHSSEPVQGDYTEEYQARYHEEMIKQIARRPYIWATHVWNMFDFAADARAEGGENGMNHKGLVTFDRKYKKDAFYAYKAWLSGEPVLHICGKRYADRCEDPTAVTVYSNLEEVELFADGKSLGKQKKGEFPFFRFEVPNRGETKLTAKAGDLTDESLIRRVAVFNEAYRMKEQGGLVNWYELDAPPGRFSVNDRLGDILATAGGKLFVLKMAPRLLKKVKTTLKGKGGGMGAGMSIPLNKSTLEMGKGFTIKRLFTMAGDRLFTKEDVLAVNAELNKIKKKK